MYKDYARCCSCEFIVTVELGEEVCPKCNEEGCLMWVDEEQQEIDE